MQSDSVSLSAESATVYVNYDLATVPKCPENGWTRFVCISDTHSDIYQIPVGDVLLHAGDLSSWGYPHQVRKTLDWLASLEHPMKIIVAGNHDLCLDTNVYENDLEIPVADEQTLREFRSSMKGPLYTNANLYYLEHEMMNFSSSGKIWHVYGSPSAPMYAKGAFQYTMPAEADAIYQKIPDDTEILITHTPPYRILDRTRRGKHAGCEHLAERLSSLKSCRLHVFGHIHEGAGAVVLPDGRVEVNAAVAWGGQPVIVDLKDVPN
ncbi:hypothetical protein AX15_002922 [Amanita polypyramis BW_CC]|nr:hypothetical protein AX15_002922 [Amanita polypyramis BW_CC]